MSSKYGLCIGQAVDLSDKQQLTPLKEEAEPQPLQRVHL